MTKLVPEQVQDLPWATLDDLLDAKEDVAAYGKCWALLFDIDGDLRMKRSKPQVRPPLPPRVDELGDPIEEEA